MAANVAQLACEDTFGPGATPRLARYTNPITNVSRWLAWVEELTGPVGGDSSTWTWTIHALASGETTGEAWGELVRTIYAADRTLTTEQAANALGVDSSTVRHLALSGRLVPVSAAPRQGMTARFSPTDILRRAGLLRDSGLAQPPETTEEGQE